ncbi:MAG TPA: arylsulfotransferase family protein [Actinospica sp.]|nr:arylsulfotransferase family protein [Actinospica sp.]
MSRLVFSLLASASLAVAAAGPARAATTPDGPPPLTVLTSADTPSNEDLFITPTGGTARYANGPEIVDRHGKVVWFHAAPQGQTAADFLVQRYDGQPVLTWWQGTGLGGLSDGTDYIYDTHYRQIAAIHAGYGLTTDGHEFLITPSNTALVFSYETATADLTSIGGPADQTVVDSVIQDIDIRSGRVLWSWNSADHVPYAQSEQPLPASASTPWDWFHLNAAHFDTDGDLLVDARNTWTAYEVDPRSGAIVWQLGGKASSFTEKAAPGQSLDDAGEIFAWQHDPEAVGHGEYTVFDDESSGTPEFGVSRVVTIKVDPRTRTATLVRSVDQPEGLVAASQGDAQTTPGGNLVVGWGSLPYVSVFGRGGQLLLNAEFPAGVNTYRAFAFPWPQRAQAFPGSP